MPSIIEFAPLHLPAPTHTTSPTLLRALVPVTRIIQAASTLQTRFFSSLTDPHAMFVIGGWPSVEAHRDGFEGSEAQQRLWPLLDGMMEIRWMEYLGMEEGGLPREKDGVGDFEGGRRRCLGVGVWRLGVLEDRERGQGERERVEWLVKRGLQEAMGENAEGDVVWARNIKKGKEKGEEDVLVGFVGLEREGAEEWVEKVKGVVVNGLESQREAYIMERTVLPDSEQ